MSFFKRETINPRQHTKYILLYKRRKKAGKETKNLKMYVYVSSHVSF